MPDTTLPTRTASPSATTQPRLRARNLRSPYAGPFDFDLQRGECVALQGPSGAGKSVLLRMVADLDPHEGDLWLDGAACATMLAPDWRARVVYQPAEAAWWEATAGAHFAPAQQDFVHGALPTVGLTPKVLDTAIDRLSTGERQRLALVRSLAGQPDVLLLDEPTSGLDPASVAAVETLLASMRTRGMAVLVVTHSAEQAARIASRTLHIEPGKGMTA